MNKNDTIAAWKERLATDGRWALRALLRIYEEQTPDERMSYDTRYLNEVGFSGPDAEILTSIATQHLQGRPLTTKQMNVVHKLMPKYAGQLYRLTPESAIRAYQERQAERQGEVA